MQAHIVAVAALQTTEDHGRRDGQNAESDENLMDSIEHRGGIGVGAGMENAMAKPATATPKLIDTCCTVLAIKLALLAPC